MKLLSLLEQGGVFMKPLLLLSVLAMAVAIERSLYFAALEWGGASFRERLLTLLGEGRLQEAEGWLMSRKGAVASTALAAVTRWGRSRQTLENALVTQSHREQGQLQKFLVLLETTVTASPLIGLLGTITGMMGVFQAVSVKLSQNPQADTSSILAGIGEALVATAAGILIAVVSLLIHNFFQRLAEKQMDEAQDVANVVLDLYDQKNG